MVANHICASPQEGVFESQSRKSSYDRFDIGFSDLREIGRDYVSTRAFTNQCDLRLLEGSDGRGMHRDPVPYRTDFVLRVIMRFQETAGCLGPLNLKRIVTLKAIS